MTPEQTDKWLKIEERQAVALEHIAQLLEQVLPRSAPNHRAILENFNNYDWSSINAEIEKQNR